MPITIAIAGKGGTGKTTFAALLIQLLTQKGTVLAIDADPSSNLHIALDLPLEETVGDIREQMVLMVKKGKFDPGMAKQDYIDLKIQEILVESQQLDLLAMGRPEGPGCYCAANNMLRTTLDRLENNYDFVVMDCEAGMEHISRQTTRDVDYLIILSDPSLRGIITAKRMKDLIQEIRTYVGRIGLVLNKVSEGLSPELEKAVSESGVELVGMLPRDRQLEELENRGEAVAKLSPDSPLRKGVEEVARKMGII